AHGCGHILGSIEAGKLADLVLWKPAFFGARPEVVLKGGVVAWSQMGDPNASIPTPQPMYMRPMFGAIGRATSAHSIALVSGSSVKDGQPASYGLRKRLEPVRNCRNIGKCDMKLNDATPKMEVDPETYRLSGDGQH